MAKKYTYMYTKSSRKSNKTKCTLYLIFNQRSVCEIVCRDAFHQLFFLLLVDCPTLTPGPHPWTHVGMGTTGLPLGLSCKWPLHLCSLPIGLGRWPKSQNIKFLSMHLKLMMKKWRKTGRERPQKENKRTGGKASMHSLITHINPRRHAYVHRASRSNFWLDRQKRKARNFAFLIIFIVMTSSSGILYFTVHW